MLRAPELVCRAWDDNMNTQPDSFTWNLMCTLLFTCSHLNAASLLYALLPPLLGMSFVLVTDFYFIA